VFEPILVIPNVPPPKAACTTAVWVLVAGVEPPALEAVTVTRIVEPTSAAASRYVCELEPTDPQLPPPLAQRCHWKAYDVGLFVHVPVDEVNVRPCCAVPLIDGKDVFTGVGGGPPLV
jgi:hypothetical protein